MTTEAAQDDEIRTVTAGGIPIQVRKVGTGPDVLFVHGVYVNGSVWDDVVDLLKDQVTCWVPTLPLGAHETPLGSDWQPTLESISDLPLQLLEALDLTDVTVVGNDSGGGFVLLALNSAHVGLGRIGRLVLTNCDSYDHLPPTSFNPLIDLCIASPEIARDQLRPMLYSAAGQAQFLESVASSKIPGARVPTLFGREDVLDDAVKATATLKPTADQQAMGWLTSVDLPVDLVWGDADVFFPPSDCDRLVAALPRTTVKWIPGARTYTQLDAPAELADVIRAAALAGQK
ncbi:MAG: alpha/beta hydrolase [Frankiales bacterium]|nr:alpha/beta hydrolase [Frankiales bacterium]